MKEGSTKIHKLKMTEYYLIKEFVKAREIFLAIHDIDLKFWAIRASKIFKLENF